MSTRSFRFSAVSLVLFSLLLSASGVKAAPVRLSQVVQELNARPGAVNGFSRLSVADDTKTVSQDDDRVIVTQVIEVGEDDSCECSTLVEPDRSFPKWPLLGLAAIPVAIVLLNRDDDKKTPTPTATPTGTPGVTPTPTTTPTATPTAPPPPPTATPEPVPEPMTILLFGAGLAGIGLASRRRLKKKQQSTES
jgi:hypothetical protein